jgi:hypothetical protein
MERTSASSAMSVVVLDPATASLNKLPASLPPPSLLVLIPPPAPAPRSVNLITNSFPREQYRYAITFNPGAVTVGT